MSPPEDRIPISHEVLALAGDGRVEAAVARALELEPQERERLTPLLSCLEVVEGHAKRENIETARELLDVAVDLGLDPVDRARWLGRIHQAFRDPTPAIEALEEVMTRRPLHPEVPYRLVRLLASSGRTGDARRILAEVPPEVAARPLLHLAECRVLEAEGRHGEIVDRLQRMGPRKMPIIEEERLDLLTIALDRTGQGREAVISAGRRRAMTPSHFDPDAFLDLVAGRVREPLPALPVPRTSSAPEMLFVVAAFRSGTTLLERLLADHPNAHGIGESELVRSVIWNEGGSDGPPRPDRESIGRLLRTRDEQARVFVVKNVDLWFQIPRLLSRFPNPRLLVLTRDPIEIGLSMWKSSLPVEQFPFLARIEWIGWYLGICAATLEHWRDAGVPGLATIAYRELVADPHLARKRAWEAARLDGDAGLADEPSARPSLSGRRTISADRASSKVTETDGRRRADEFGEDLGLFQDAYERGHRGLSQALSSSP